MNWESKALLVFAFASLAYTSGDSIFGQDPRAALGVVGLLVAVYGSFFRFRLPSCQPKPSRIGNMLVTTFGLALVAASYHWTFAILVVVVLAHPISAWFAQFEMTRSMRAWHRLSSLGLIAGAGMLVAPAYGYVESPWVLLSMNVFLPLALIGAVAWHWYASQERQHKLPLPKG